jgi:CSLREA domain-containing protein
MAGRFGTLIAAVILAAGASVARGATFTIDDTADLVDQTPGDGVCATVATTCTLRAAIQEANALPGKDDIVVKDDLVGNITLTIPGAGEDAAATGDLDITEDVDMNGIRPLGPDYGATTGVDGGGLDRIFHVLPGVSARIYGFAILNGIVGPGENGGGILNEGALDGFILVSQCSAGGDGGGLYNSGTAETTARYRLNTAGGRGGAIANVGTLLLERDLYYASIARNSAPSGGGIYNAGTLTANAISVMENDATAGAGGGLLNDAGGTAHLANLTFGANTATSGGEGIDNAGSADLAYVTVNAHATLGTRNDDGAGATTSVHATILGDACTGSITSGGYDITAAGCALTGALGSDQIGIDPELESHAACAARHLGDVCPHYRPQRGSPAIDAGDPANCKDGFGAPLSADQDAVQRPTGSVCDVGAIESTPVCFNGAPTQKAKLVISGIGAGPGRQTIRYVGRIQDGNIPRLSYYGAQLAVEDLGSGDAFVDRSATNGNVLGAGGSIPFSCHMWKSTSSGFTYREIDRNCPFPPVEGMVKSLKVKDPSANGNITGYIDLKFTVNKVSAVVPTGPLHVAFTYTSYAYASNGHCAETTFGPTACTASGSHVKCLFY